MEFCEKLVRLRKSKNLTQDELAKAIGVSRQAVYKWECGQSYPEALKLVSLKELFGITVDNLLDESFEVPLPLLSVRRRAALGENPVTEEPKETTNKEAVSEDALKLSKMSETADYTYHLSVEADHTKEEESIQQAKEKQSASYETVPSSAPEQDTVNIDARMYEWKDDKPSALAKDTVAENPENVTKTEKWSFFRRLFGKK